MVDLQLSAASAAHLDAGLAEIGISGVNLLERVARQEEVVAGGGCQGTQHAQLDQAEVLYLVGDDVAERNFVRMAPQVVHQFVVKTPEVFVAQPVQLGFIGLHDVPDLNPLYFPQPKAPTGAGHVAVIAFRLAVVLQDDIPVFFHQLQGAELLL